MGHATLSTYRQIINKISKLSHGPAGKPAVKRSRRNANKFSGGGGRRVKSSRQPTRGTRALAAMHKSRAAAKKLRMYNWAGKKKGKKGPTRLGPPRDAPIAKKKHQKNPWTA